MKPIVPSLALAAAMLAAAPAGAHVVLSQTRAEPGAYFTGSFRVSHGCDGSPTTALTIVMPLGIVTAKPQPKPGWTLKIEREPLAAPVAGEGGRMVRERVKSITWSGRLPDDEYDEFGVTAKLPDAAGPLYFPAVQACERGETRWVEIPAADGRPPTRPAPALTVEPAGGGAVHAMPGMEGHRH